MAGEIIPRPNQYVRAQYLPEIVEWISEGKTLRSYCRQPGKPSYVTVYEWLKQSSDEAERIACAREMGHDAIADECIEIIDNAKDANLGKAQVWTRLQLLAKWNPKKYGDKLDMNLGGGVALQLISDIPRPQKD